jgi:hypothetical protein
VSALRACGIPKEECRILWETVGIIQSAAGQSSAARNFVRMPSFNPAS